MNNAFGFMDLLPTLIVLALAVVAIYYSTTMIEAIERLFVKKKSAPLEPRSKSRDR
jgi:hypothetical protein